ncbi:MAG: hypothetical protein ACETWK_13590 [Candidatus Aminicenantaceae bacterium]
MEKHVNILGALWIVYGALGIFISFIVFGVLFGVSFIPDVDVETSIILRSVGIGVSSFIAIISIPCIIGGIWLMKRKEWARILVLALAFLNLIDIPIGTALGIYSIVVLFREETVKLFRKS